MLMVINLNNYPQFPTIYPDESFYSICARFRRLNTHKTVGESIEQMFGSKLIKMNLDFPHHLDRFCSRIPVKSGIDINTIIFSHTLMPLFLAFMEPTKVREIIKAMRSDENHSILYLSGITQSRIPLNKYLRLCPECFHQDDQIYGEPYWHRSHQVFGVNVCPIHQIPLHTTSISTDITFNLTHDHLVPLSEKILMQSKRIEINDKHIEHMINNSRMVFRILTQPFYIIDSSHLADRYIQALKAKFLATTNGTVKKKELLGKLTSFLGEDYLESLHFQLKSYRSNWIDRLLHPKISLHPLYHLLFIQFLGLEYEEVVGGSFEGDKPFGDGPWICLNGANKKHYGKHVIKSCKVERATNGAILGTFTCSCGFCYTRRGPDKTEADRDRIGSIVTYGPLWMGKLYTLKYQKKLTQNQISKILKVSPVTVGRKLKIKEDRGKEDDFIFNQRNLDRLNQFRDIVYEAIKTNPNLNRTQIRELVKKEYIWLYRHDKDWLSSVMPKRSRKSDGGAYVDWAERDRILVKKVQEAVHQLQEINIYKRPEKITLKSIARQLESLDILRYDEVKLPLTYKAIKEVIESQDDYRLRRIRWAVRVLSKENVNLTESKIRKKASIQSKDLNDRLIREIEGLLSLVSNAN
jgi:hypothetical protein